MQGVCWPVYARMGAIASGLWISTGKSPRLFFATGRSQVAMTGLLVSFLYATHTGPSAQLGHLLVYVFVYEDAA